MDNNFNEIETNEITNNITCSCGDIISAFSLPNHLKSNRHTINLREKEDTVQQVVNTVKDMIDRKLDFQFTSDNNEFTFVIYN